MSHRPVVVQKYGGSSVSDLDGIRTVARRVVATHRSGRGVVVVVSAMGNTTNELLGLARELTHNPGRRELDMLISVGERVAMALLSMAINDLGVPAQSFTGSQSGIITDEAHNAARIVAVRPQRLLEALDQGKVAIVAGFQGVSREREVTTLGRGGTDLTAVALAAALDAEWCEICSDVDGIYSADPRVVPEAVRLETMSLDEVLALARNGARVLQADAVAYAHRHKIALLASHTEQDRPGTRIQVPPLPPRIVAVTSDDQLERFQGDAETLLRALLAAGAPIRHLTAGELWVDLRNWHDREAFVAPEPCVRSRIAVVTAASGEAAVDPELVVRGLDGLRAAGVRVDGLDASGAAIRFVVSVEQAHEAERIVHRLLAEPATSS